jgi:hypothetical protein
MMRTMHRLHNEGIRHFAMVHDSFGVHACDIDLLHRVLREEFVGIYSEPVLMNFAARQSRYPPGPRFALFFRIGTFPSSQRRGGRDFNILERTGWSVRRNLQTRTFRRPDHPVRGFFGGFASSN